MSIHIAVAFDSNYITPFYVLATSVFANNKQNNFTFHAIATGINNHEKQKIVSFLKKHNSTIFFYELEASLLSGLVLDSKSHVTIATYFRLFFPLVVGPDVQRLIYMDVDVVVIGSLTTLYQKDMKGFAAAAVPEVKATRNRPDLGIVEEGQYFNAGILLMDIAAWKAQAITEKALRFVRDFPEKVKLADQDALNVALQDNYLHLEGKYNVIHADVPKRLCKKDYKSFLEDKVILHYTLSKHKPWHFLSTHKFRHLYHEYKKSSPRRFHKKYTDFTISPKKLVSFYGIRAKEILLNYPKVASVVSAIIQEDISQFL